MTAKQFGGARLPKERSFLPKGFVSRRYFVYEAEARAEPRRWMCHRQIIPLVRGFIVSTPDRRQAQRPARRANWRGERQSGDTLYASG